MLTVEADQDYYLDLAELEVLSDWFQFDPTLFTSDRDSAATDANGILLLPTTFLDHIRIEDGNEGKYYPIDPDKRSYSTGWYGAGYDVTTGKRRIQMIKSGRAVGSTTFYFYTRDRVTMGATGSAAPIYPLEFRDLIAMKAAQLYFEDQGESYDQTAISREARYNRKLQKAEEMYGRQDVYPEFADTTDPDVLQQTDLQRTAGYID